MSVPRATLIIATYKREAPLRETLQCVAQLATPNIQVIVVDQTPVHEEATTRLLGDLAAAGAILWLPLRKASLPLARNVGLVFARAPIVIFIDDDVAFGPDFVAAHLHAFAAPDVWGSAGRVHLRARVEGDVLPPTVPPASSDEWFDQLMPLPAVATARGCNMAFRRDAAFQLGGFDTRYRTSTVEDEDFCFGVRCLGGRIVFAPDAWLIHRMDQGGTRAQPGEIQGRADYFHDRVYFLLKNLGLVATMRTAARTYRNSIANKRVLALGSREIARRHGALLRGAVWGVQTWLRAGAARRGLSYRVGQI